MLEAWARKTSYSSRLNTIRETAAWRYVGSSKAIEMYVQSMVVVASQVGLFPQAQFQWCCAYWWMLWHPRSSGHWTGGGWQGERLKVWIRKRCLRHEKNIVDWLNITTDHLPCYSCFCCLSSRARGRHFPGLSVAQMTNLIDIDCCSFYEMAGSDGALLLAFLPSSATSQLVQLFRLFPDLWQVKMRRGYLLPYQ